MKLTTDQKINLLILAGFEPRHINGSPRVVSSSGDVLYRNKNMSDKWTYVDRVGKLGYDAGEWTSMMLNTCPDELIYQAIETTG